MDKRLFEIANKCHKRIAANNGYFQEVYFIGCIYDALKEAEERQWISVEERLPEDGAKVLVFNGQWMGDAVYMAERGHFTRCVGVTHWMPLPELSEKR